MSGESQEPSGGTERGRELGVGPLAEGMEAGIYRYDSDGSDLGG